MFYQTNHSIKVVTIILFTIILFSCNWGEEHEYVLIEVTNAIGIEVIEVDTGLGFVHNDIQIGQSIMMSMVKGVWVSAYGKTTGFFYGRRKFFSDGSWVVGG